MSYFIGVFLFNEKLHWMSMVGASEIWVGLLLMACENMGEKQKEIEGTIYGITKRK